MKYLKKEYWDTFLAKKVVTRSIGFTLVQIVVATALYALLGYIILCHNGDATDDNLVKLYFNTAKFGTWFLLGYAGMQAFGYDIEKRRLSEFEEEIYSAHAQVEFNTYTSIERSENDDLALKKLADIDSQKIRVKGDSATALKLFTMGVIAFFVTSVLELVFY